MNEPGEPMSEPTGVTSIWDQVTQEGVNRDVRELLERCWAAERTAEKLQEAAEKVQEMADDADREKRTEYLKVQRLVDAVRLHRPDLTIPEV